MYLQYVCGDGVCGWGADTGACVPLGEAGAVPRRNLYVVRGSTGSIPCVSPSTKHVIHYAYIYIL